MSAPEKSPNPRRVLFSDVAAEQHQIAGGAKASGEAKLLKNIPEIAQVFETTSGREIEPSERLWELRLRIENKVSGDDLRHFNKRRHVRILAWLKRVATHAGLRRAGLADDKSYAAIGAEAVELLGVSLNPASRDSVTDLRDDFMLAFKRFDRISKRQSSLSNEGRMKLMTLDFTLNYLLRNLKLPTESEIRAWLEERGYQYRGATLKNIERQWKSTLSMVA